MQTKLKSRKGFTLIEVMVVLVIMAILATMIGAGIISYMRTARFNKNETNARTVFQTAQTALTRLQAGGGAEEYLANVKTNGIQDTYYTATDGVPDAAKVEEIHKYVYALFYDKNNPTSDAGKLVTQLIGNYVYDETLMDGSICLEIDVRSGEVFAVFYDSNAEAFSFDGAAGTTDISDRSFEHRADESLVGYYSTDDLVNVVKVKQLKIQTISLINKEALTLSWKSNAVDEYSVFYTIALYGNKKGEAANKFAEITVDIKAQEPGGDLFSNRSTQANLKVSTFDASGASVVTDAEYTFPLSCKNDNYTLTLDAMMSADLLQAAKNGTDTNLFSITRLLPTDGTTLSIPDEIYAEVTAFPHEGETNFVASKAKNSNTEHPLFGENTTKDYDGLTGYDGKLTYYRHLYNLRWLANDAVGTFTLRPETANNGVLKWADSKNESTVVVYEQVNGKTQAATPKLSEPVAFPTVETLPAGIILKGDSTTLANLQLRTESVPKYDPTAINAYYAKYVGLFGHNYGTVNDLVLQDVDAVVNLAATNEAQLNTAVEKLKDGTYTATNTPLTALRGVGALCGINTGIIENVSMTQSAATATSRVVAVVPFGDTFTTGQSETSDEKTFSKNLTTTALSIRGIGGIAGVSRPTVDGETPAYTEDSSDAKYKLANSTVAGEIIGQLLDKAPAGTLPTTDEAYYTAAQTANDTYHPLGIGGVAGMVVAQKGMGVAADASAERMTLTNKAVVYGNGYTGGVFGNLLTKEKPTGTPATPAVTLTGLTNVGRVVSTADAKYSDATQTSTTLGRFFGGITGYTAYTGLDNNSSASTDKTLTMADVTAKTAALLKGDFVGGITGFADHSTLTNCITGSAAGLTTDDTTSKSNTFVLGKKFVGGIAGGNNETVITNALNYAIVLGQKYVGGIASVNSGAAAGAGTITGAYNYAPVGAVQLGAAAAEKTAFVGGIVGYNGFGDSKITTPPATVAGCASTVIDNSRLYSDFLTDLKADTADFVGGIAGYNAGKIDMGSNPSVVLVGRNFVGGIVGGNAAYGAINNTMTGGNAITVSGSIVGNLATGGLVGYNRGSKLPAALGFTGTLQGYRFVGGIIGANLPEDSFTLDGSGTMSVSGVGSISGDAVVGGIIGYNQVMNAPAQTATQTLAEYYESLLPTFTDGAPEDGILREQNPTAASGSMATLTGLTNSVGINANAYAGGIIGYNAENTTLTLASCTNSGSISRIDSAYTVPVGSTNTTLATGASVNGYLGSRSYATAYRLATDTKANFIGGIAGINTQNTTLKSCTNTGAINGSANVLGGITGLNEGKIDTCANNTNLGSSQQNYVGGIAGINAKKDSTSTTQGIIINSTAGGTVTGGDEVGGLVGANLWDAAVATNGLNVTVNGKTDVGGAIGLNYSHVVGVGGSNTVASGTVNATGANAGGIVGHNMPTGTIDTVQVGPSVTVGGTSCNGGIVGLNEGTIGIATASGSGYNVVSDAVVSATQSYAGGIAGQNKGTIQYAAYDNASGTIRTTLSCAGGIAGANETDAVILRSDLLGAKLTASNGIAGGITAQNAGTVDTCKVTKGTITASRANEAGTTAADHTIGAVAAYNAGEIKNSTITGSTDGSFVLSSSNATSAGSIAGYNDGTVTDCTVNGMPLLAVTASSVNVGGAVGYNSKDHSVTGTQVTADISANDNYTNLGGVVGSNDGTLDSCTYTGTLKGEDIKSVNNTAGGIAGNNGGTLRSCTVTAISLQATGATNVNSTMTADAKLTNATHIGGVAGRNNAGATIDGCTVAGTTANTSMITAKNGFVGGVAGSNAGSIINSGGASAYTAGGTTTTTLQMMQAVNAWTATAVIDGTTGSLRDKTTEEKNNDLNAMIRVLTNSSQANADEQKLATAYAAIKGVDTVSENTYDKVYNTAENGNELLVALKGGNISSDMASGYLGGITGFNTITGSVQNSATGKWFVYSDNATMDSTIGGAIGQNESNAQLSGILNCAAVRRYTHGVDAEFPDDATWIDDDANAGNERKAPPVNIGGKLNANSDNAAHVGGVIGYQQNRTGGDWAVTGLVNCGTVFNSRSNNVGGVIAYWQNNGGTVQRCYNFGNLTTNMNDGQSSGGVGGIVGYYDKPTNGIDTSILSCQNHGNVYRENKGANDVAGIVGRVSIGAPSDTMTINVSDCVNGNVKLQAHSMACGIFGYMGPLGTQLDYIAVNIDRCRNFCTAFEAGANAGIVGDRSSTGPTTASTTVTNCFALYQPVTITGNPNADKYNPIARSNNTNENLKGSGNYYMDANSFDDTYIGTGLKNMNRSISPITSSVTATLNGADIENATVNGAPITSEQVKAAWFDGVQDNVYIPRTNNALKVNIKAELAVPVALQSIKLYYNGGDLNGVAGYSYTLKITAEDGTTYTSVTDEYLINQAVSISALTDIAGKKIKSFEADIDWTSNTPVRDNCQICEIELVSAGGASINYSDRNDGTNNAGESAASGTYGGNKQFTDTRLYAGIDNGADSTGDASNFYNFFAADLAKDDNGNAIKVVRISPYNSKIASTDFADPTVERGIVGNIGTQEDVTKASLPLLYNDNDGDGKLTIHDVIDETIQDYYANILDAAELGAPENVVINFSGAGASTSVYGRYEVKWDKPAGTPQYYEVKIYLQGENGEADTLLKTASAYNTAYTFDVPVEWKDSGYLGKNIYATVTAINSKSTKMATSAVIPLAQPLPTPVLRMEHNLDQTREVSLVNIADYTALSGTDWKVVVTLLDAGGTAVEGEKTITEDTPTVKFSSGVMGTFTLRAYADVITLARVITPSQAYFRSELMSQSIFIPQWYPEDNNTYHVSNGSATVTGSNATDLKITATINYKLRSISPMYHVALVGVPKNTATVTDEVNHFNLANQYITLAYKDVLLTDGDTVVTFETADLPADLLENYEQFEVLAEPSTSGLGDYYYFHDLTADELAALAADKSLGDEPVTAIRGYGYEIIANADGTYTYRSARALVWTELGKFETSTGYNNQWWFRCMKLNITTLDAPTLNDLATDQPAVTDADMTYTFTWTAPADTGTVPASYAPTVTGVVYARNDDGTINKDAIASEVAIDVSAAYPITHNTETTLTLDAEGWNYDAVRLTVARLGDTATNPNKYIGKTATRVYDVKQRLVQLTAPTATLTDVDRRNLRYTISWDAPTDAEKVNNYTVSVVDTGAGTPVEPLTFDTVDATTQCELDLEAFAGRSVAISVVSKPGTEYESTFVRSPAGITLPVNVPQRYPTPNIIGTAIKNGSTILSGTDMVTTGAFKTELASTVTLASGTPALAGNYLYSAYFFDSADAAATAAYAINVGDEPAADSYQDKFAENGAVMTASGTSLSISLAGLSTDNTGRYMVVRVCAAPNDGIASTWKAAVYKDSTGAAMALPQIKLDAPAAVESTAPTTHTATLTVGSMPLTDTTDLTFQQYTVEWGKTELATGYTVALTPLKDTNNATDLYAPATVAVEIAPQDVIDTTDPENPVVTTHAGSITKVTKTVKLAKDAEGNELNPEQEETIEIPAAEDGSYDLSTTIELDGSGVPQMDGDNYKLVSQPVEFTGEVLYENEGSSFNAKYHFGMVPILTFDADTGLYRVALPDNATIITEEDTESIHHNTGVVAVQALGDAASKLNESDATETIIFDPGSGLFGLRAPADVEATPEPTPAPTATATPEPTATATPEPTATATPEPTATATPEPTATATPEPTATATPEP